MRAQGEADLDAAAVSPGRGRQPDRRRLGRASRTSACAASRPGSAPPPGASGTRWPPIACPRPTDDACRALHADLKGRAQGFRAQLETVEDAARKADVLPVRVREVFDRHRLR